MLNTSFGIGGTSPRFTLKNFIKIKSNLNYKSKDTRINIFNKENLSLV